MSLRVLILGAGATGGYFGGRLAQAVHNGSADVDVTFLVRPQRADMLKQNGLVVRRVSGQEGDGGGFTLPVRTIQHTELKREYDIVLLACKAYDLESSILSVYPAVGPDTLILPVLNGLAHFDRLDLEFGKHRVLGGCCHLTATLTPEGIIQRLSDLHSITFGIREGNATHARPLLDQLQAAFLQTPVRVCYPDMVLQDIWEKFAFLATFAGMTCLMRAATGDIMAAESGRVLVLRMFAECEKAAEHAGYPLRERALESSRKILTQENSSLTASMLRDLESGGKTEGAHIVGDMRKRALAAGSDATMLSVAWAHLQARNARLAREARHGQ